MKNFLIILFSAFISTFTFAQEEHMKFMGIPLDGTINQFQTKLATKGMTVDYAANKYIGVGSRRFKGFFSGEEAVVYVYYNEKTKNVYRAKVVIDSPVENIRDEKYKSFVSKLSKKYINAESKLGTYEGREATSFSVPNKNRGLFQYLGYIDVYCVNPEGSSISYALHLDYFDAINLSKYENKNMDDL